MYTTYPSSSLSWYLQHIVGEAIYFVRETLEEAVRSSRKYVLDSKVSIDGCHTKELQGGCEGEKPGNLFTVLPQPSQTAALRECIRGICSLWIHAPGHLTISMPLFSPMGVQGTLFSTCSLLSTQYNPAKQHVAVRLNLKHKISATQGSVLSEYQDKEINWKTHRTVDGFT
jgi:hypothetical protein